MIQSCTCFADVNECITGVNNCDANADCNNTEGSFECTCKPGYSGNGVNCTGDFISVKTRMDRRIVKAITEFSIILSRVHAFESLSRIQKRHLQMYK